MSGPKSYSVSVFDKQLKLIFLLQSEISSLWEILNSKKLLDIERGVEIGSDDFLVKNKKMFDEFNNPFSLTEAGTINQEQYDKFYNRIHSTIGRMDFFKEQLQKEILSFEEIETAYHEYLELEKYLERLNSDFKILKADFVRYINEIKEELSNTEQLLSEISKAELVIEMPPFNQVFIETRADWKHAFDKKFENQKKQLNQIPLNKIETTNTKVVKSTKTFAWDKNKTDGIFKQQAEYENLIKKIEDAIAGLSESKDADTFRKQFDNLLKKQTRKDTYFFTELLEEVTQSKIQADYRESVKEISRSFNGLHFDGELNEAINTFGQKISATLARDRLKSYDVESLKIGLEKLKTDQQQINQTKFAEKQERNFIKARLINELQELDYEVMTDMNVVDFANDSSFLFRTPGQENFINLRFDQQGQLLYNFLIPEKREELSHEKTQIRLTEMQQTCEEFKGLLTNLKKQGLKINLEKEIEASIKALIQLPARFAGFKADVKKKSASKSAAEKKKFLK